MTNLAACGEYLEHIRGSLIPRQMNPEIPVEPKHCHHVLRHNAFIVSAKESDIEDGSYILTAKVDHKNENFFFDHYIDHIPGMLSANIIRQAVVVVSHIFLGIGFDKKFTMSSFESEYSAFAELDDPITVKCKIIDPLYRNQEFSSGTLVAELFQNGHKFATGSVAFRVFPKHVYEKLRFKTKVGR